MQLMKPKRTGFSPSCRGNDNLKRFKNSKRGTTSVFLTMILASMLLLTGMFIHAASQAAGKSYADAVLELAGRSILSEYDLQLKERYGIYAVHTDEKQAEEKIKSYAEYSFHEDALKEAMRRQKHTNVLKLKLKSVDVSLKGYSITDVNLFEAQVLEYMKYDILREVFASDAANPPSSDYLLPGDSAAGQNSEREVVLRNDQIINSLPSRGYEKDWFSDLKRIAEAGIPSLEEIKRTGGNNFMVNEYIIRHFLNHGRGKEAGETFFRNEVEYVLKGYFSDDSNYSAVRTDLFILRNVMNLGHIFKDPNKRKAVETIAAALTLAKGKEIGALVVAEAWAAAESENDLRLLEAGKRVPLTKSSDSWAVPLSDTLEYIWGEGYIHPERISGYDYEDYLRILLFFENREQKLLRCMDLIQLNMKGSSNGNFDLKEYYGGFEFQAVVGNHRFSYIQQY